jgi:hypothetical protein
MNRAELLARQIDRAERELAALEEIPDPALMAVETVIFWQRTMPLPGRWVNPVDAPSRTYMYVALKVPVTPTGVTKDGACWYVTGRENERYTDDELRETLAHETVSDRYVVAEWLPLEAYEPASPFDEDDDGIDYLTNNS